jgi:hypothetical protein
MGRVGCALSYAAMHSCGAGARGGLFASLCRRQPVPVALHCHHQLVCMEHCYSLAHLAGM